MSTSGVHSASPSRAALRFAVAAMGTRFELVLCEDGRSEPELRAVGEEALAAIVEIDARLSRFRRDSLVAWLEREAVARPVPIGSELLGLFDEASRVHEASGGLFDVTLGAAMERLGLHPRVAAGRRRQQARAFVGRGFTIDREAGTIQLGPGARLDLGGIAKGHAVDGAAALLRERGVANAILHGGTSAVAALGAPHGRAAWMVAIALPQGGDAAVRPVGGAVGPRFRVESGRFGVGSAAVVDLRDECLAVSAPHGRAAGGRHHIVDPRTGESAACARLAAIVGPSCRTCDAWTKPALIARGRPMALPGSYDLLLIDG